MTARRSLLGLAGVLCLVPPGRAVAQAAARPLRLGILRPTAPTQNVSSALLAALGEAGYTLGRNLAIEGRFAAGQNERLPELARELVAARVDVLVCVGSAAVEAGRKASATIPIIMFGILIRSRWGWSPTWCVPKRM
jgi:putative tryptophan/tyrosine transport system substrate-binding protein